jgi:hypothetical protein
MIWANLPSSAGDAGCLDALFSPLNVRLLQS